MAHYRVVHKLVDHFILLPTTCISHLRWKFHLTCLQYLKYSSKCCSVCPPFAAITEAIRCRNCPVAGWVKSIRNKHVYLWHHKWCHKEYLTWTYHLRIVSLAYTLYKKSNCCSATIYVNYSHRLHGGLLFFCATVYIFTVARNSMACVSHMVTVLRTFGWRNLPRPMVSCHLCQRQNANGWPVGGRCRGPYLKPLLLWHGHTRHFRRPEHTTSISTDGMGPSVNLMSFRGRWLAI